MPRSKCQKNFRISPKSAELLRLVKAKTGMFESEIIAICLAKYALSIPSMVENAEREIVAILSKHLGKANSKNQTPGK